VVTVTEPTKATAYIPVADEMLTGAASFEAALLDVLNNPRPPRPPEPPPAEPAGYRALLDADAMMGALRAVVELHAPVLNGIWWECRGCDADGHDWEPPIWPCSTTELVARVLGVQLRGAR
jgi:hypothetical protein